MDRVVKICLFIFISVDLATCDLPCNSLLDCADMYDAGKTFTDLIKLANIENKFTYNDTKRTLFLPSKSALDSAHSLIEILGKNKTELKNVLLYHLVPGVIRISQLQNELILRSDNNYPLRANIYKNSTENYSLQTISGAKIILGDQNGGTGMIQMIDRLLHQLPVASASAYILTTDRFSTFVLAASKANILNTLTGGNFTVFLPNNAAFSKLPPGKFSTLLNDPVQLKAMVNGHLVNGTFYSEGLVVVGKVSTMSGSQISVTRQGGNVTLNSGSITIVNRDINVINGVVHEIDTVILPG